jgi:hypothetical protein
MNHSINKHINKQTDGVVQIVYEYGFAQIMTQMNISMQNANERWDVLADC